MAGGYSGKGKEREGAGVEGRSLPPRLAAQAPALAAEMRAPPPRAGGGSAGAGPSGAAQQPAFAPQRTTWPPRRASSTSRWARTSMRDQGRLELGLGLRDAQEWVPTVDLPECGWHTGVLAARQVPAIAALLACTCA